MTNPVFVALDTSDLDHAKALANQLKGHVGGLKLGLEFFSNFGPSAVADFVAGGMPVFLDLKFHDIPNTVGKAVHTVSQLGVSMLTVHLTGGENMLKSAVENAKEGAAKANVAPPLVIGISVLTSLTPQDLAQAGIQDDIPTHATRLAQLAVKTGMDGIVAAAQEVKALRVACGEQLKIITPGIRPAWATGISSAVKSAKDDQARVVTPADAISWGADYLVIGRPITQADDPTAAALKINDELNQARAA